MIKVTGGVYMTKKLAIFGDSVLRGVIYDRKKEKYVFSKAINWKKIEKKLDITIDNHAKMGATIKDGKKRLDKYLVNNPEADMILIEFGGNDCDFDWTEVAKRKSKKHLPKTTPKTFKEMLIDMVKDIQSRGIQPILMTLPTIDAKRYFNWITRDNKDKDNILYFLGDIEHIYRFHELYNLAIIEVSVETQVDLIDIRKVFLENGDQLEALICHDGIHPSSYGEKLIVKDIIEKYKTMPTIKQSKLYNQPSFTYN